MDYKKKYEEALEKAKGLYNSMFVNNDILEQIFPELEEIENEKIKKELILYFENLKRQNFVAFTKDGPNVNAILDWLEKQDKQSFNISWHDVNEEPEEGREIFCEWKSYGDTWHDVAFYHAAPKTFCGTHRTIENVVKWAYVDEMFSRQKSVDNTNKIEPKFKVGDWVIDKQGIVHQVAKVVENVTDRTYGYDIVGGGYFNDTVNVRLWTIQDAKDGDILADDNKPFIFKGLLDIRHQDCPVAYCGIDCTDCFSIGSGANGRTNWWCSQTVKPATKEQRKILFEKMREAGYEWDYNKKELVCVKN